MLHKANAPAGSPTGSARARPRLGTFWGSRRALPRPAAVPSDEQILALVAGADGLSRRQRQRYSDGSPSEAAGDRLLRLDWAVRAGQLVLADRAAQGLTSTSGSTQSLQGQQ